jgi:hypothetical protein
MSEIDKARDAAWDAAHGSYDSNRDYFDVGFAAGLATATAKIEALEAKLATAERLINEINDARAANWHLQRRRENDQFEWFSSTADSVFGPFPTALEAFAAVRKENTGA